MFAAAAAVAAANIVTACNGVYWVDQQQLRQLLLLLLQMPAASLLPNRANSRPAEVGQRVAAAESALSMPAAAATAELVLHDSLRFFRGPVHLNRLIDPVTLVFLAYVLQ